MVGAQIYTGRLRQHSHQDVGLLCSSVTRSICLMTADEMPEKMNDFDIDSFLQYGSCHVGFSYLHLSG